MRHLRSGRGDQIDEIKAAVLALPEEARAEIIDAALDSLFGAAPLSDAWKAEIKRRSREIDEGAVELIENEEGFAGDEIDRAWIEEARRRYEAIRSGAARLLEHDEVVSHFRARFGESS